MDYETLRNSMTVQDAVRVLKETNCYGTMDIAKSVIIKALDEKVSSSEKPNKWIPISKEVPEESGYYLTTTMFKEVFCDFWNGDTFDRTETVIAWQKLPLPYRAESEEKKMNDSFELTLNNPLTEEDWDKITDVELENTPSITFKTPKGKQVKYIKSDILDKMRKEIQEKEFILNCTKVSDVALKHAYIEALKIIDKYKAESEE